MLFIEQIENHRKGLQGAIDYAKVRIEAAQEHLDLLEAESKDLGASLKLIAKGKEPKVDLFNIGDITGANEVDFFVAYDEAVEASDAEQVQKAVADLLERYEEEYCDSRDRDDPHHLDYDCE